MISRSRAFQSLASRALVYLKNRSATAAAFSTVPSVSSGGDNSKSFHALSESQKIEILSAVKSLKNYKRSSTEVNERRRKLFGLLNSKQQKLAKDAGYLEKLDSIDDGIASNYKLINDAADYTVKKYGISQDDFNLLEKQEKPSTASGSNYRVIEALGHYTRDWTPGHVGLELLPVFEYVASQLELLIEYQQKKDTALVFPGSGLGRLAYEFSKGGYGAVFAIESSGLMNSLVDFNYSELPPTTQKENQAYTIYPHIHTNSDFYNTQSQLRTFEYKPVGSSHKPDALVNVNGDFLNFEIPARKKYKNIVVVSVFFLDTAENLIAYLDKISELSTPGDGVERGYWINAGPLKYGSAAQVELNADELAFVRDNMGWVTASSVYSVYDPLSLGNKTGLVGYLTDKESMWQGYYGLNLFTSSRKENKSYRDPNI
ncbi:uncharacterized protein LODBEIA_P06650 [Lodderomyces beijingensis]|uniref:Uncharacterized protein n=1 Tax=Lodderomyces beijingensis TaxID=1775926 RepID=A0ABP0ZH31_9ASCO